MTKLRLSALAASMVLGLLVLDGGSPARADTVLSTATDPTAVLDARLTQLLGNEKKAFKAVSGQRLKKLVAQKAIASSSPKIEYSRAWLDAQPVAKGGADWSCLTEALYFEARGESAKGQFAVAEVILNRVSSQMFPNTVCKVVNQGTGKRYQCQFTYTCDGKAEKINEPAAYARAGKVARLMLDGAPRTLTDGATHYHTRQVNPKWARKFPRTASIGVHYFYRHPSS